MECNDGLVVEMICFGDEGRWRIPRAWRAFAQSSSYFTDLPYLPSPSSLQMCRDGGRGEWFVWCRWGRVGEIGANSELGPFKLEADASAAFAKKFKEKTRNKWEASERQMRVLKAWSALDNSSLWHTLLCYGA